MPGEAANGATVVIDGNPAPAGLDEATVHAVVHGFYAEIRTDPLLGPLFNERIAPEAWPTHLDKMCAFWSSMLLRTGTYEGRPLPPHLAIPELGEAHFRRWLTLFRRTVQRLCTPDVAALFMQRALRIAHSFRLAIAFNRGQDSVAIRPITEHELAPCD